MESILGDSSILKQVAVIIQVIWIDAILSIDNAAALAVLAEPLPKDRPPPWPLNWRFLGSQQDCALKVGVWMAFIFRGALLLAAVWLLTGPLHVVGSIIGGSWLLFLAFKHFFMEGDDSGPTERSSQKFWVAIFWIEVTDLTFSFDNVAAISALSKEFLTLFIGILISVPMIRLAATKMIPIMERIPVLEHAAYLLITAIGIELLIAAPPEPYPSVHLDELQQFAISLTIVVLALLYHYLVIRRRPNLSES